MKSRQFGAIAIMLIVGATWVGHRTAAAQQLAPGSIEFAPRVSFSHWNVKREGYGNVDNFTQLEFTPTVGVCLTQHHEITAALVVHHEAANSNGNTRLGALTGYQYNFTSRNGLIPFVGLGLGANFGQGFTFDETSLVAPALTGGVRFLVGNSGSVNLSLGYEHETDNHVSENRMTAAVGVSLFPWKLR